MCCFLLSCCSSGLFISSLALPPHLSLLVLCDISPASLLPLFYIHHLYLSHLPRGIQAPHINASWWENSGGKDGSGMDTQMPEIRDWCSLEPNNSEHFLLINNCATTTKKSWCETSIFLCSGWSIEISQPCTSERRHWDLQGQKMTANRL